MSQGITRFNSPEKLVRKKRSFKLELLVSGVVLGSLLTIGLCENYRYLEDCKKFLKGFYNHLVEHNTRYR